MKLIFENWNKFLDEAKEDDVREKYKNKLDNEAWGYLLKWITENRGQRLKFLNWAAKLMVAAGEPGIQKGPFTFPDAAKQREFTTKELIPALQLFADNSQQLKSKSIDAYKTPGDIKKAYYQDVQMKTVAKARKARGKYKGAAIEKEHSALIHTDDHLFVVRPFTTLGSCFLGSKTKWCISQEDNKWFKQYVGREGKGFYFIKDDRLKEKHKFSKVALQLSNEEDFNYPCEGGGNDFFIAFGFQPSVCFQGWWNRNDNPDTQSPYPMKDLLQHFSKEEIIPILKKAQADFAAKPAPDTEVAVRRFAKSVPDTYSAGDVGFEAEVIYGHDALGPTIVLKSRVALHVELPFLKNYKYIKIRNSYAFKAEDDIKDAILEMPMPHKYSGVEQSVFFSPMRRTADVITELAAGGESRFNSIEKTKNAIEEIKKTYSKEEVAKLKNKVTEIFKEKLMKHLDPEWLGAFNKEKENDEKYKKATKNLSLARKKSLQEGKKRIKVYLKSRTIYSKNGETQ